MAVSRFLSLQRSKKAPRTEGDCDRQPQLTKAVKSCFEDADQQRTDEFNSLIRQIDFDSVQAEIPRKASEQQRINAFRDAQSAREASSLARCRQQEADFEHHQTKRNEIFRTNDHSRNAVFEGNQAARAKVFRESLELYTEQQKSYTQIVKELISAGHHAREKMFSEVCDEIITEFDLFLQAKQLMFDTVYQRKLSNVKLPSERRFRTTSFAELLHKSMCQQSDAPSEGLLAWSNDVSQHKPASGRRTPAALSDKKQRSLDDLRIPSGCPSTKPFYRIETDERSENDNAKPTLQDASSSPSAMSSRPESSAHSLAEVEPNEDVVDLGDPLSRFLDFQGLLFIDREETMDAAFKTVIETHHSKFEAAESLRTPRIDLQETEFQESLRTFKHQFERNRAEFWERFKAQNSTHDGMEERRTLVYNRARALFDTQFQQRLSWYARELKAITEAEETGVASPDSKLARLLDKMEGIVQDVRSKHGAILGKTRKQPIKYSWADWASDDDPSTVHRISHMRIGRRRRPLTPPASSSPSPSTQVSPLHRSPKPKPVLQWFRNRPAGGPMPETDFSPRTLVRAGGFGKELPTATPTTSTSSSPQSSCQGDGLHDSSVEIVLGKHRQRFLDAQERRLKEGERMMTICQQIYAVNELKRQSRFQEQQTTHANIFSSTEHDNAMEFMEDQRARSRQFEENEAARERRFREGEKIRSARFECNQASRELLFSSTLDGILRIAREQESEREMHYLGWGVSSRVKFKERLGKWEAEMASEREESEEFGDEFVDVGF